MTERTDALDAIVAERAGEPDSALAAAVTDACTELTRLRTESRGHVYHNEKRAIAQHAWEVARPLFEQLDTDADGEPGHELLTDALRFDLVHVIDDPYEGPGLLRQAAPDGHDGDDESCCITRIEFRNRLDVPVRVTASDDLGTSARAVFEPGDERPLRRADDSDDSTIPGGLGDCVTITVERAGSDGSWVELFETEVCCDDIEAGETLSYDPHSEDDDATHEAARPVLDVVDLDILAPCPPGGTHVEPDGRWGEAHREDPGRYVEGKGYFVGGHVRLLYDPPSDCERFCFIQAAKRTVTIDGRPSAASHDWQLDLLRTQSPSRPCYAYQTERPEGGRLLNDSPGLANPWGRITMKDGTLLTPKPGTELVATWEFRTWAVCLRPPAVYGQFDWRLSVELDVPPRRPGLDEAIGDVDLDPPTFTPRDDMTDADVDLFRRVMQ